MVLELRPAHNPTESYGFDGCRDEPEGPLVVCLALVPRRRAWHIRKVIDIPAEPADAALLPPLFKAFGAVPPLVTDINLSLDDRFLYVSCWGTGELKQFDVSDPFNPVETGSVRLGGIVRRQSHPANPDRPLNGAPADGGNQPRWQTRVPDELALPHVGRAGLPGRHPRLARQVECRSDRRARARSRILDRSSTTCGRTRSASKAATLSSDSYCFA